MAGLTAAGAAVRFATLSVQSFWLDEAVTHQLVTRSLARDAARDPALGVHAAALLRARVGVGPRVRRRRGRPALALGALRHGDDRAACADRASPRRRPRGALAAAALAAANPLLIWYSQEARAYALLVALCAVTVWCLLRRDWIGWAIAAALALATHYFAVFIVVPELAWALSQRELRPQAARAALALASSAGGARCRSAITQAGGSRAAFIHSTALASRVVADPQAVADRLCDARRRRC